MHRQGPVASGTVRRGVIGGSTVNDDGCQLRFGLSCQAGIVRLARGFICKTLELLVAPTAFFPLPSGCPQARLTAPLGYGTGTHHPPLGSIWH